MADRQEPEPWVDGWRWNGMQFVRVDPQDATMSLDTLREIVALAGLHIVSEADKRVLDAVGNAVFRRIKNTTEYPLRFAYASDENAVAEAELARRAP